MRSCSPRPEISPWRRQPALAPAAENQRGVHPAKGEVVVHHVLVAHHPWLPAQVIQLAAARVDRIEVVGVDVEVAVERLDAEPGLQPATGADRKSTRLNSSHVKISYAAFC